MNPATLTVNADAKSKSYVDDNPTIAATVTGYKNGEDAIVFSGNPELTRAHI